MVFNLCPRKSFSVFDAMPDIFRLPYKPVKCEKAISKEKLLYQKWTFLYAVKLQNLKSFVQHQSDQVAAARPDKKN